MPRTEYSPHKRTRIACLKNSGYSHAHIASVEGVPAKSISGIVKRYQQQQSGRSQPRAGRPKALSNHDMRRINRSIIRDPFISAAQLISENSLQCTDVTVIRELKKAGVQHYKALRRPKLTQQNAQKRLEFARKYINKPTNF